MYDTYERQPGYIENAKDALSSFVKDVEAEV